MDLLPDDIDHDIADYRHVKKSGTFKYMSIDEGAPKSPGKSPQVKGRQIQSAQIDDSSQKKFR